jgi:hypothetical protein
MGQEQSELAAAVIIIKQQPRRFTRRKSAKDKTGDWAMQEAGTQQAGNDEIRNPNPRTNDEFRNPNDETNARRDRVQPPTRAFGVPQTRLGLAFVSSFVI